MNAVGPLDTARLLAQLNYFFKPIYNCMGI